MKIPPAGEQGVNDDVAASAAAVERPSSSCGAPTQDGGVDSDEPDPYGPLLVLLEPYLQAASAVARRSEGIVELELRLNDGKLRRVQLTPAFDKQPTRRRRLRVHVYADALRTGLELRLPWLDVTYRSRLQMSGDVQLGTELMNAWRELARKRA